MKQTAAGSARINHPILAAFMTALLLVGLTTFTTGQPSSAATLLAPLPLPTSTTCTLDGSRMYVDFNKAYNAARHARAKVALRYAIAALCKPYNNTSDAVRFGPYSYDCSGLVYSSYAAAGVYLGVAGKYTTSIRYDPQLSFNFAGYYWNHRPGDLVWFETPENPDRPLGHMGIILRPQTATQPGLMIDATTAAGRVVIEPYTGSTKRASMSPLHPWVGYVR